MNASDARASDDTLRDLRGWLEREHEPWIRATVTALDDAIQHLQELIFEERWDELVAAGGGTEQALRESVRHYERGIAHLFGFVRAAGIPSDEVGWSTLKAEYRRAAFEAGVELTLRTALETGIHAAAQVPLREHARYLAWRDALMLFGYQLSAAAAPHPGAAASLEERIGWAYGLLGALEEREAFAAAVSAYLSDPAIRLVVEALVARPVDDLLDLQATLLPLQRFDLILNTMLLWLADAGAR